MVQLTLSHLKVEQCDKPVAHFAFLPKGSLWAGSREQENNGSCLMLIKHVKGHIFQYQPDRDRGQTQLEWSRS